MRGKLIGVFSVFLFTMATAASAQTPTPVQTPVPTPTPPPIYISDPIVVNTETTGNQRRASVAIGAGDNHLVVWNSDAAQAGFYDIKGQLFTRDGVKIGSEFQVDEAGPNRLEYTPNVAADGLGNYIVVWADFNNTVTDSEIQMRRYDGAANPLGGAVPVNTFTTGRQRLPRVAADSIGQFVVVWESEAQDGSGFGVFGQRFDETGAPAGAEFAVNTYTTGDQDRVAIDMDDQGFTVAFNDGSTGIAAREFGTFAGNGASQFAVLGANHRFADVARLQGTANTFFVAENTATGRIDGIRTVNGVAQSPFPAVQRGFNPRLARPRPVTTVASLPTGTADSDAAWIAWENETYVYCQKYGLDFEGFLFEEFAYRWWLATIPDVDASPSGAVAAVAQSGSTPGTDVTEAHGGVPHPLALPLFDDNANGVLEPNESAAFSAFEEYFFGEVPLTLNGVIENYSVGTTPQTLTIDDSTADYGTIPPGGSGDCQATGDCYGVTASGARPGVHWDEAVLETLSTGVHKRWLLHIGESFADVPKTNPFYAFIENLLHNGVTGGGACGGYCPTDGVKRQQMAVFLLKARFGPTFTPPPATGTVFADVPLSNPFAPWIEALALLGITGGCSGGPPPAPVNFCPDAIVNRQQMAVFLLKTLEGSAYVPPDAAGIFQDVPLTNPFVKWIEELYARGVTGGCVPSPLQYCPANPTNRQQMAAFLVKTFGLLLYGP